MTRSAATLHITNGDGALYLLKKAGDLRNARRVARRTQRRPRSRRALARRDERGARALSGRTRTRKPDQADPRLRAARRAEFAEPATSKRSCSGSNTISTISCSCCRPSPRWKSCDLEPGRIAVVQSDHYLANMTVDEILRSCQAANGDAAPSSSRRGARGSDSPPPSPADLYAAAGEDAIGLPFLRAALRRLCEEYPWKRDGLSRSQRQALYAVARGRPAMRTCSRARRAVKKRTFSASALLRRVLDDLCARGRRADRGRRRPARC